MVSNHGVIESNPLIIMISHQFSDLSFLVSHSKSSAYDTHRLALGLSIRPIVTESSR